jgi:cytoskeleton protein RodZ
MMEDLTQVAGAPDSAVEPVPPVSLGGLLREARERMGLSVGDVANQIKFAPRQIEALEADDFSAKPEAMFLRGDRKSVV